MKLSTWAKDVGIGYMSAWRLVKEKKFPGRVQQLATGTWIVYPHEIPCIDPTATAIIPTPADIRAMLRGNKDE